MKKKLCILLTAIVLTLMPTFAFSGGDLVDYLTPITDQEKLERIGRITLQRVDNPVINGTITQFDVNANGNICCVSESPFQKEIWVIESNDTNRIFTISVPESIYVCWLDESILVLLTGSDWAVAYDMEGNITGAYETTSKIYDYVESTTKIINGSTYYLERSAGELLFLGGYDRLLKKDEAGNITTIYDIEEVRPMRTSWGKIGIWMILIPQIYCGICALIWLIVKRRKRKKLAE